MPRRKPPLTVTQILAWADSHRDRTGRWPTQRSGPVAGAPGEAWSAVFKALREGLRSLPRVSLHRLLARRLGARNRASLSRPSEGLILRWADAHRRRTGRWPQADSGPVEGVPAPGRGAPRGLDVAQGAGRRRDVGHATRRGPGGR